MKMRQSLEYFERAFHQEAKESVVRRERLRRQARERARVRRIERTKKQGKMRFAMLALAIVATAVIVTIAMFETLTLLVG